MTNEKINGAKPRTEKPGTEKKRLQNEQDIKDFYAQLKALDPIRKAQLLELIKTDPVGATIFHGAIQDIQPPLDNPVLAALVVEIKAAAEASAKVYNERFDPGNDYNIFSKPKPLY